MTDLVERLRPYWGVELFKEAADEIERLRGDVLKAVKTSLDAVREIERLRAYVASERPRVEAADKVYSDQQDEIERLREEIDKYRELAKADLKELEQLREKCEALREVAVRLAKVDVENEKLKAVNAHHDKLGREATAEMERLRAIVHELQGGISPNNPIEWHLPPKS